MLLDDVAPSHAAAISVIRSDRGTITVRRAASGVLVAALAGELDASVAPRLETVLAEHLSAASRPITMCWDLAELCYFDPAVREVLTDAVRWRRLHVTTVVVLATAPWVRLGVSAAALALALTDVRVTDDRAAFDEEVAMAVVRNHHRTTSVRELAGTVWSTAAWVLADELGPRRRWRTPSAGRGRPARSTRSHAAMRV